MTAAVHDFKSIRQKLERQEQKAEFEAKNPKEEQAMYGMGWPYGVAVPFGGVTLENANIQAVPLKSQAHPGWPYAGTPFEWSKFVKVKI